MGSIIGIPTTRVSDLFIRHRLLNQLQSDQLDLFKVQVQMSTGRRIQAPSEDANAAMRIMKLQRLLERKEQVRTNLSTNQSFLSASDNALSLISNIVAETRGASLEVLGTIVTDTQRDAVAQQVQQAIQQLMDAGNQQFRGRYLFAGTDTIVRPFEMSGGNAIAYRGNEGRLASFSDVDLLFDTNLHGSEVFGAVSDPVLGSVDLNPVLTYDTRLVDLNAGTGVALGSILITGDTVSSTVDVSTAETIGDVANLIRANPPTGKTLNVEVSATGLVIELIGNPGDLLTIREVGGGTTAEDLGIVTTTGVAVPVVGSDLAPILRLTTRVDDILGRQAYAVVRSAGADNDLIFRARANGLTLNGTQVIFQDTGMEALTYVAGTLTFDINGTATTAATIMSLLQGDPAANAAFSVTLDPTDVNLGNAVGQVGVTTATLAGGSGTVLDRTSGLQVVNGGKTHLLDISTAETIEDILNVFNMADAGLLAEINENKTGIDVRSRISGADFMVGENGGTTATQLGLRSFTNATRLEDLNFGRGVADEEGGGTLAWAAKKWTGSNNDVIFRARRAGPALNGFTISFAEGVPPGTETFAYNPVAKTMQFGIVSGSTTAADLAALLESDVQAVADFAIEMDLPDGSPNDGSGLVAIGGAVVTARGESPGADFTITVADGTEFEIDLSASDGSGFVAATDPILPPEVAGGSPTSYATATVRSTGLDNDLLFRANNLGTAVNSTKISFQATPGGPTAVTAFTAGVELTFAYDPQVTTAQGIITALQAHPGAAAAFSATLDSTDGSVAETVGDVLTLINSQDPTKLRAQAAAFGNGIELIDLSGGTGALSVTRSFSSMAAIGLGLIPEGQSSQSSTTAGVAASATIFSADAVPNNEIVFTAVQAGPSMNGVQVVFNPPVPGGPIAFTFDANTNTLTVDSNAAPPSTANNIIAALAGDPRFTATLPTGSDGSGLVAATAATLAGGTQTLTGADVNPLETEGLLTALLRLQSALEVDDIEEAHRAIDLLDQEVVSLNFSRAELGARQQGLDIMQMRLEDENVNLRTSLSEDFDVDMVEAISEFTGRQIAMEASLRTSAAILQMTLLNYL